MFWAPAVSIILRFPTGEPPPADNVTLIVQFAPTARLAGKAPHVVVPSEYLPPPVLLIAMLLIVSGPMPVLVNVKVLVIAVVAVPNVRELGNAVTDGAWPVPLSETCF